MKKTKIFLSAILAVLLVFMTAAPAFAAAGYETPYENSEFFEIGDYSIHYRVFEAQNEKGRIMMIHGFALSGYCWENLASALVAEGYTCVTVDLPDFGYSSRETADTEALPREDIVHALMEQLGGGKWYVAGHSMGGYVALALAEKYPESVKNVLLYGTSGNDGVSDKLLGIMTNPVFVKIMGAFMEGMAKSDLMVRMLLIAGLADKEYARNYDLKKVTQPLRIKSTGAGALYSFAALTPTDYDGLSALSPVLYVNGSKDNVIGDAAKDKLRSYLPEGSKDVIVDGGGHMFIENYSADCARITLTFLAVNP